MGDEDSKTIYRLSAFTLVISAIGIGVFYLIKGNVGRAFMGLASLLFLFVPYYFGQRDIKIPYRLSAIFIVQVILGYSIGFIMGGYDAILYYDKLVHFHSGFLFFAIGLCAYAYMQNFRRPKPGDVLGALFFAMFIALLNEFVECSVYVITGYDAQRTLSTGVMDTMGDLSVCLLSSLISAMLYALYLHKGVTLFKAPIVNAFIALNSPIKEVKR